MPVVENQDVWKTGTRVYVIESTDGPLLDLGTIEVVSPAMETEEARLEDSDGGIRRTVIREITRFTERYDVTLFNLNMRNLRYLFFSEDVQNYSQTSTPATSVPIPVHNGKLVKVKSAAGVFQYNLKSIDAVRNAAGTVLSAATQYTVDLARGLIAFATGAAATTSGELGEIDYTATTMGAEERVLKPQSKLGNFTGTIIMIWGRGNNQQQTVREFTGTIIPGTAAFSDTDYSNFPITIEVEADLSNVSEPAGRLLYFKGAVPEDEYTARS